MWDLLFKTPILNILIFLNNIFFNNMAGAIIGLTLLVRFVLLPLTLPAFRSSKKIKELQPHLDDLKDKHSEDQEAYMRAQMELYQEHGINPLGGCLPLLLSIPVMVALYQVLLMVLNAETAAVINERLYFDFLKLESLSQLGTSFLWLDLARPDRYYILPVLVGAAQFLNAQLLSPQTDKPVKPAVLEGEVVGEVDSQKEAPPEGMDQMAQAMQSQFKYIFPIMTVFIVARLPAGVALYWLVSTLFGIIQSKLLT